MPTHPDVVIFMTDQQRGVTITGDHPVRAQTPRLDAFAGEATRFDCAYATSPHCCPSRTSFFTGRYPSEHGVWNNVNVPNALSRGPRAGTPFWSEAFAAAGYRMGFTGKWHVDNAAGPAAHGWRELGPKSYPHDDLRTPDDQRTDSVIDQLATLKSAVPSDPDGGRGEGEIIRPGWPEFRLYGTTENPFGDADVVAHAEQFLAELADPDEPFVLYVGPLGPHDPYIPPQRFLDLYDPDEIELPASFADPLADKPALYRRVRDRFDQLTEREHREALRHYLAFCSYEDHLFGRVLDALKATGRYDDAIVLYLSDHGDYTAEHGLWAKGLPSFLPAYHVPLLIRNGAADQASASPRPLTLADLGPTLVELCGIDGAPAMSGESVAADLAPGAGPTQRTVVLQSNGNEVYGIQRIVLTERWKLVVNLFDDDELYDRLDDPDEMINLIATPAHPERRLGRAPGADIPVVVRDVVRDLYGRLWQFALAHDDDILNPYILTALTEVGPMGELG